MLLRKASADEPASQASKRSSSYKSPSSSSYRKSSAGKFKYSLTPILLPFSNLQSRSGSLSTLSCGCTHRDVGLDWPPQLQVPRPTPITCCTPSAVPHTTALRPGTPDGGDSGPVFLLGALTACTGMFIPGKQRERRKETNCMCRDEFTTYSMYPTEREITTRQQLHQLLQTRWERKG